VGVFERAHSTTVSTSRGERAQRRVRERTAEHGTERPKRDTTTAPPGTSQFGDLLIERRRRREALDAHIASLSSFQRTGMIAMVRHGLGLRDRGWQARYDELVAALDEVERAVHKALGVMDIAPNSEHAVRVGG
jgi:hypothetical protein